MIQVTRDAFVCDVPGAELEQMRQAFDRTHALHLRRFVGDDLLELVREAIRHTAFSDRNDSNIAREALMAPHPAVAALLLVFNDPRLFDLLTRVTGCAPIVSFVGRMYRMQGAAGHYDRWHSDATGPRLLGISVNFTEGTFEGGRLELRPAGSDAPSWTYANTGPGDAVLFRIDEALEHRVTTVDGEVARVAFAGWFQSAMPLLDTLKTAATRQTHEVY